MSDPATPPQTPPEGDPPGEIAAPVAPAAAAGPVAPVIEIDPKFAKAIDPATPAPVRMMAARGIVPGAKPSDILTIQFALSFDPLEAVSSAAKKSLAETPANVIKGAFSEKTHSGILDVVARGRGSDEDLIEFIVLRKQVQDDTLMYLAETSPSLKIVEIIGKNQERLLQNPMILDSLRKNAVTPKSLIDVTVAFLQMAGVLATGAEARAAGLPERIDSKLVDQVIGDETFDDSLTAESGDSDESNAERQTKLQEIASLTVAQKVKLAYKANKEARQILLRETNRVVVTAVLGSGRMTDGEIIAMAQNPVTASEILRTIDKNRDWVKSYQVQKALACNPKTPQAIAVKWVRALRFGDLASVARSSNVQPAVRTIAKQIHDEKQKHR